MYKVSIIVPIYNGEKYLEECINSLLNQTYKNIEIILINDGSSDGTSKICKKYINLDNRIIYKYQKNSGVSIARNNGLDIANGHLVMFVDCDDFLDYNVIESIVKNYKKNTLLCFGYKRLYKNKVEEVKLFSGKILQKNSIILEDAVKGYLWNKVFELEIIKKNKILFDSNVSFTEDLLFVSEYINYVSKIKYIDDSFYNYRIRKNSVTGKFCNKKNISILKSYEKIIAEFVEDDVVENQLIFEYLMSYFRLKKIINKECAFMVNIDFIKSEKEVLKSRSNKEKIKYLFVKYFPNIYEKIKVLKKYNMFD